MVPVRPFLSGSPGCVRSSARIWACVSSSEFELLDEQLAAAPTTGQNARGAPWRAKSSSRSISSARTLRVAPRFGQRRLSLRPAVSRWARIIACALAKVVRQAVGRMFARARHDDDVSKFGSKSRP